MVQVKHQLPGRVRLRVKAIEQESELADRLRQRIDGQAGIVEVRANAGCASLVVRFDPTRVDADALTDYVRQLLAPASARDPIALQVRSVKGATRASARRSRSYVPRVWLTRVRRRWASMSNGIVRRLASMTRSRRVRRRAGPVDRLQARLARRVLRSTIRCWWDDLSRPVSSAVKN